MLSPNASTPSRISQLIKFGMVGLSNTGIDLILFAVLYNCLHFNYVVSHMISYSCGIINSFVLNKVFTFRQITQVRGQELFRFLVLNGCSFLLSLGLIYLFSHLLLLSVFESKLLATLLTVGVNFLGSKYWCFVPAGQSQSESV